MRSSHIGLVIVLALLINTAVQASASAQSSAFMAQLTGRVKGTVMDLNEAVIPSATIVFEKGPLKLEAISDESGNYEIELPAGTYQVTSRVNLFVPFRRAPLFVQPNTTAMANVVMWPVASDIANPPVYYESFSVLGARNTGLSLLIQFLNKRKHKGVIEYENAIASYNALTIYAGKVRFDPRRFHITTEGNTIVEDGKKRVRVKYADVGFKQGEPILKLIR